MYRYPGNLAFPAARVWSCGIAGPSLRGPMSSPSEKQAAQEPVQDHEPTKDRRKNVPFLGRTVAD